MPAATLRHPQAPKQPPVKEPNMGKGSGKTINPSVGKGSGKVINPTAPTGRK